MHFGTWTLHIEAVASLIEFGNSISTWVNHTGLERVACYNNSLRPITYTFHEAKHNPYEEHKELIRPTSK